MRSLENNIGIVIVVHNGETTLSEVFKHLETQKNKDLIKEIIIINDNSTDRSLEVINNFKINSKYNCRVISNEINKGLAQNYNEGFKQTSADFVITMHQDILLKDTDSFGKIAKPVIDENVAASYPILLHPKDVWITYPFWQRAMFSRFVDKEVPMLTGKFDCFRKSAIEKMEYFDYKTYRTSGEDSDMKIRLKRSGYILVKSDVRVVHLHNTDKNFGMSKYIAKENQLAESRGVTFRKHGSESLKNFLIVFFRQALLVSLFVPILNFIGIPITLVYIFIYNRLCWKLEYISLKTFTLPFVNFYILFSTTFYSLKGFITSKQYL